MVESKGVMSMWYPNTGATTHITGSDNKVYFEFDEQRVKIREAGTEKIIAEGHETDGLYQLPLIIDKSPEALAVTRTTGDRWHECLGHLNNKAIKQLAARNLISLLL